MENSTPLPDSPEHPSQEGSRGHVFSTHDHDHAHSHLHEHDTGNHHSHHEHHDDDHHHEPRNVFEWLLAVFHLGQFAHDNDHSLAGSITLTTRRGIWAVKISFIGLMATALLQVVIVYFSGSVALLADTIHNFGDAATAIPLWIAFTLSRRPKTRRYTYGFNRAEDLAGLVVVGLILFSALTAGYEAIMRFIHPQDVEYLGWVAAAAIIGFLGNETVAIFRIRVGREIGSAALIADGQHARIDGLTSLAVLAGAIGVWLGFPLADPIVGLLITFAILRISWNAIRVIWYRMMDAVDPEIVDKIEQTTQGIPKVKNVHDIRCRWLGHQLNAVLHIEVDPQGAVIDGHQVSEDVQHALFHTLPRLTDIVVHVDPYSQDREQFHQTTWHHRV